MCLFPFFYEAFRSLSANISNDDAGFIYSSVAGNFDDFRNSFLNYVPGRNLHILWNEILFTFVDSSKSSFWQYHFIQALAYLGVVALIYFVQLKVGVRRNIALIFSLLALYFPTFTVIILWSTSLPQHLLSALFLLLGITFSLAEDNFQTLKFSSRKRFTLVGIFLTLGMFTYDQVAAVVIIFTFMLVAFQKMKSHSLGRLFKTSIYLNSYLLISVSLYLLVFFSGRGTGDNLTVGGGTIGRLSGNLLIPLRVLQKINSHSDTAKNYFFYNPTYVFFGMLVFALIFVALLLRSILRSLRSLTSAEVKLLQLGIIFLIFAFVAYLPAAVWYVSPRHLFLPIILGLISVSIFSQYIYSQYKVVSKIEILLKFFSLILIVVMMFGFHSQISNWLARDLIREQLYSQLETFKKTRAIDCLLVDPKLNEIDSNLYSETPNYALDFYNGRAIGNVVKCEFSPILVKGKTYECNILSHESWYVLRGYGLESNRNQYIFEMEEVCP